MEQSASWWQGKRGEWYVIIQIFLFILVIFGPRSYSGRPDWPAALASLGTTTGIFLLAAGGFLVLAGAVKLGKDLTPLPHPKEQATLKKTGPYRLVRHPIYSGAILMAFGWALLVNGTLTVVYAVILLIFFDFKSRREEKMLKDKFPDYHEYQRKVRKLIPFIY